MTSRQTYSHLDALTEREAEVLQMIAEGHSNREIAERLVVTVDTVKWYNRQIFEKLAVKSRTQAAALARESGLLDAKSDSASEPPIPPKNSLPTPLTSFVGRGREVREIIRLVREHRLVTLTGPAGTGKTRLAVEASSRMLPTLPDGAYFVDLARIQEPSQLGSAIAATLDVQDDPGMPVLDYLVRALTRRPPLLLLDNFEHILDAAPFVSDLLDAAPDLRLLITSRETLRIYGEQEYPVLPLSLPSGGVVGDDLRDYAAVDLFLQRAESVRPDFAPDAQELAAITAICQRLDGLPLAIELAAARIKFLSPKALLGQLDTRLNALDQAPVGVPDRHRTLRAAIAWSHDLLNDESQALFARLGVFRGGRSIEAVAAVCGFQTPGEALKAMESLVNKTLLVVTEGPEKEPRFVMLETIHEYAREMLDARRETEETLRKHADYFARFVKDAEPATRGGPDQIRCLTRLWEDYENIRAAMEWSLGGGDPLPGMVMIGALGSFWLRDGHYAEGQSWTVRALKSDSFPHMPAEVQAGIFYAAGIVAFYMHDPVYGKQILQKALALYEALGDDHGMGLALTFLAAQYYGESESYSQAVQLVEESISLLNEIGDLPGVAQAYTALGELARMNGDLARANSAYEKGLEISQALGDVIRESSCLSNLGTVAHLQGEPEKTVQYFRKAFDRSLEDADRLGVIGGAAMLGGALAQIGYPARGWKMMSAGERLMDDHRVLHQASDVPLMDEYRAAIQQMLDEEIYRQMSEEGRAMTYEELIAFVLENPEDSFK